MPKGKMMRGKYWGNAEEARGNAEETRGNKNPAMPWGLRDENSILRILLVVVEHFDNIVKCFGYFLQIRMVVHYNHGNILH